VNNSKDPPFIFPQQLPPFDFLAIPLPLSIRSSRRIHFFQSLTAGTSHFPTTSPIPEISPEKHFPEPPETRILPSNAIRTSCCIKLISGGPLVPPCSKPYPTPLILKKKHPPCVKFPIPLTVPPAPNYCLENQELWSVVPHGPPGSSPNLFLV